MVAVVATVVAMVATQWLLCSCYIALTSGALQHCTHSPPQFVDCLPPPYTTLRRGDASPAPVPVLPPAAATRTSLPGVKVICWMLWPVLDL